MKRTPGALEKHAQAMRAREAARRKAQIIATLGQKWARDRAGKCKSDYKERRKQSARWAEDPLARPHRGGFYWDDEPLPSIFDIELQSLGKYFPLKGF